jgi:hypothetical protein
MTSIVRPGVLLCAVLVSSPALWNALWAGTLETDTALTRFLIALVLCAVARAVLVALTRGPEETADGELVEERRKSLEGAKSGV